MGCTNSKLDDLPAVALCRDRCGFLDDAIRQRYVLSQAHLAYFHSLKNVGASLNRFFDHQKHLLADADADADAELLNLPPHRKAKPIADPPKVQPSSTSPPKTPSSNLPKSHLHQPHHSRSSSGSHLHFHSDDDSDDDHHHHDSSAPGSLHHDDHSDSPSSPLHQYGHFGGYPDSQTFGLGLPGSYPPPSHHGGGTFVHMNFMRNQITPSVSYQQQPLSPEIVRMGEASSSYSYYPYPNAQNNDQNSSFYPPYFNYPNYGTTNFRGSSPPRMMMSYHGSSSLPPTGASSLASTSKEPPPPPPSPPKASAWEFLNPFESFDKYYPPYTPSRDSGEVREEEGIPDLEEEDYQQEVVKEVHGNQKFLDGSEASLEDEEEDKQDNTEASNRARPSAGMESDAAEYEVRVLDKQVVDDEDRSAMRTNVAGFRTRGGFRGDSEVIREIQVQLERASESGNELAKILEVGQLPYNRKHAAYHVSSKMLHAISPSLSVVSSQPSTSESVDVDNVDPALLDAEGELNLRSKNLSSTLQKLYLWEKKLYEEVKY